MREPSTNINPLVHRYVPQGHASKCDDAPGWSPNSAEEEEVKCGPVCWKCKGCGTKKIRNPDRKKDKKQPQALTLPCPVCKGSGHVEERKKSIRPGTITRGRKRPRQGWKPNGPMPAGITVQDYYSQLVQKANFESVDVEIDALITDQRAKACPAPAWLPQVGEELCNLVGSWRILQKVGSHRWTTDDLVTTYVALDYVKQAKECNVITNYLDLGTGNASVLQMVTWGLLGQEEQVDNSEVGSDNPKSTNLKRIVGVEARSEAAALAKRSLQFNLGDQYSEKLVTILNSDFRDVSLEGNFDLITGTPPYFQVNFSLSSNEANSLVSKAVIHEGGMPTCKQSAPARCEFRGGMEAYCQAASRFLSEKNGSAFIVCENWLNHDRTIAAAEASNLRIHKQIRVHGRENKGVLFCVYVMQRAKIADADGISNPSPTIDTLVVRTVQGDWTQDYKEKVLRTMSIPYLDSQQE